MFTRIEKYGTVMRLRLYGSLDGSGAQALRAGLQSAAHAAQGDLLLDLSGVDLIDDDGLGAVVFLFKQMAARRRRLRVVGINDTWQSRLRELGLAELVAPTLPPGPAAAVLRRRRPVSLH